jgi:hypothetical protein
MRGLDLIQKEMKESFWKLRSVFEASGNEGVSLRTRIILRRDIVNSRRAGFVDGIMNFCHGTLEAISAALGRLMMAWIR